MQTAGGRDSKTVVDEALRIVAAANESKVVLRIFGAAAIRQHCPNFGRMQDSLGRRIGDIDLASYDRYSSKVSRLIKGLGYEEEVTVSAFGGGRLIFERASDGMHCDVFLDRLRMSHVISFEKRLELDYPTVTLADLFLGKMQIFRLNEKDVIDTMVLLREHAVGPTDAETINSRYVAELCSRDWGLWRTVSSNIEKVAGFLPVYDQLTEPDRSDISSKLLTIQREIEAVPKSLAWRLRARVGESRKWYSDVEELYR